MKKTIFVTLLIGTLSQIGYAQNFDKAKLDRYFNALEKDNFYGSILLTKDGKTLYSKSVGFADVENGQKINENTKFRIGSISKMFTSVIAFKLAEQGKLNLNQTIDKYFPTVKNANKITIDNLLNHHSGIFNFTNDKTYSEWETQPKTEKEMIEIISKYPSAFEPNSKGEYSNTNYVLLSYILQKITKTPYARLVQDYITKPLNLKNTYFGGKINPKNNEAYSYVFTGKMEKDTETDTSILLGAGGMVSTTSDLSVFIKALHEGKLINKTSLEKMKTIKDGYGNGIFQYPYDGKKAYGHTGGIDSFGSIVSYFPEDKISEVILSSTRKNLSVTDISKIVLDAYNNKPYEIPVYEKQNLTSADLDKYLGVYSSKQLPLKITVTKDKNQLIAQAEGQGALPLESSGKDQFRFVPAGIVMEFSPAEKTFILKQGGVKFKFTKE